MISALLAVMIGYQPPALVFGFGGQSNSSARDPVRSTGFPDPSVADRILIFRNDWTFGPGVEPADDPTGQLDGVSRDSIVGTGHAVAFAERLAKRVPNRIILVPCAKGGSKIESWLPEQYRRRDRLYGSCLWRMLFAARYGEIAGFLWYQGEADALSPDTATPFRARTQAMFDAIRLDTNEPDLTIVYAQLHPQQPASLYVYWDFIRSEQYAMQRFNQIMVPSLGRLYDSIHLSAEAQIELGHRMADAYLERVHGVRP